jgi:Flp pilus assembly pilin Flp
VKRFVRNEEGVAAVIVVLFMVVIIGFSALVIDYGSLASHRRSLQNAVDAASLAAAACLPSHVEEAEDTAADYLSANAPGAVIQSVTLSDGNKKVTVTAFIDVDYSFARAFVSSNSKRVTAKASAISTSIFGPYDYALFSGSEIDLLQFTGQNYISGDVHSNNSVKNIATIDGTVTAVGLIDGKISATHEVPGYNVLAMPDFSEVLAQATPVSQAALLSFGATYKNGTYTMSPAQLNAIIAAYSNTIIYVSGNMTIDGSGVCAKGSLVASGNLTFNGSGVDMSTGDELCLASTSGNITFDGGGGLFRGILFAPKGEILFNGRIDTIEGCVIGDVVRGNGGLNIYYDSDAKNSIPDTEIMLVE